MATSCEHEHQQPIVLSEQELQALQRSAAMFAAMADALRLRILLLLQERRELCVSELAALLGDKVNTTSMRLKKLHDAGLLSKRRDAKHIHYRLKDEHVAGIIRNAYEHSHETETGANHDL